MSLLGPLRMDYEKAIRSVRAAASRALALRRRRLRGQLDARSYASQWRRRGATTTSCSASPRGAATPRSSARSGGSRASSIPTSRDAPDADERFREVAEAYEVLSKSETRQLYDRYGHAGLRSGGFRPTPFDFGSLADLFSAFFGDDLFGVGDAARGAAAAPTSPPRSRSSSPRRRRASTRSRSRSRSRFPARRAAADGVRARHDRGDVPDVRRHRPLQQVSRSVFGEFVRSQACPRCGGDGPHRRAPVRELQRRRARASRSERSTSRSRPASTTGSASGSPARATPGRSAAGRGDALRARPRAARRALRPRGRRHRLDGRPDDDRGGARHDASRCETLDGAVELEFAPGTQPGEVRVLRGRGMPVLQGFGRGDHRVLVNVAVPRRLTDEQRAARGVRAPPTTRRTGRTRASSRS